MAAIVKIVGREILDSRGYPTLEVDTLLDDSSFGRVLIPSGASTGAHEAVELRDGGLRYGGKGVQKAISSVNEKIFNRLRGMSVFDQEKIDRLLIDLDNTDNKSHLGANAILGVSLSVARAAACSLKMPLYAYLGQRDNYLIPTPMMNVINGGAHADNAIDFQEFMIIPAGAPTFKEAMRYAAEIFYTLKDKLRKKGYSTALGDEGGVAPLLKDTRSALDFLMEAIDSAGFKAQKDIYLGLDCAATEFFRDGFYHYKGEKQKRNSEEQVLYLKNLVKDYPIISIEDGMAEDDWEGWYALTRELGSICQLVGDDLFVTNSKRLHRGIQEKVANSILIKVNQIGTLTETLEAISLAKKENYSSIMSHRSGETEDTIIADLAVATSCGQIKAGSLARSDRVAKYNQLLRIEEILGSRATYAGKSVFSRLQLN